MVDNMFLCFFRKKEQGKNKSEPQTDIHRWLAIRICI